jgi:hypothetical protein
MARFNAHPVKKLVKERDPIVFYGALGEDILEWMLNFEHIV